MPLPQAEHLFLLPLRLKELEEEAEHIFLFVSTRPLVPEGGGLLLDTVATPKRTVAQTQVWALGLPKHQCCVHTHWSQPISDPPLCLEV